MIRLLDRRVRRASVNLAPANAVAEHEDLSVCFACLLCTRTRGPAHGLSLLLAEQVVLQNTGLPDESNIMVATLRQFPMCSVHYQRSERWEYVAEALGHPRLCGKITYRDDSEAGEHLVISAMWRTI